MKYDLVIVTYNPFPNGMAATNRLLSYAKGLAKEHKVLFLTYAGPAYGEASNYIQKGVHEGIDFMYMYKPYLVRKPNKIIRAILLLYRMLKLYFLVLFVYRYRSLLLYSGDVALIKKMRFICNVNNAKLYSDITEAVGARKTEGSLVERKNSCKYFDGIIAISHGIYNNFLDNIDNSKKFLLPVLVDMDRFPMSNMKREKYFFCCSGANLERDGLLDSMKGFLLFNKNNPGYKFVVASALDLSDEYHVQCKKIMDENSDVIEYIGSIPSNEIPNKLMNATALLLTPHNNYKTQGFPTKLGEYLASATPTICSTIDDLTEVLDKDCVYWVSPNNPIKVSEALEKITSDVCSADKIGMNGRKWMEKNCTYQAYYKELKDFLKL